MKVFQQRVLRWLETTFPSAPWTNLGERRRRFLEEALELLQSLGMQKDETLKIVDYVFNREPGDPAQELGGVMVTLGALSGALGLDMEEEGEREITRIEHPSVRAKVQEKQKAKDSVGIGFEGFRPGDPPPEQHQRGGPLADGELADRQCYGGMSPGPRHVCSCGHVYADHAHGGIGIVPCIWDSCECMEYTPV